QHARQFAGQFLRRGAIQIVDEVPAQDAVDSAGFLWKSFLEKRRQGLERAGTHVPIEIGEQILDEDLASQLLAEEADVAADDRTEVDEYRCFARRQARQELAQRLGREHRIVVGRQLPMLDVRLGL